MPGSRAYVPAAIAAIVGIALTVVGADVTRRREDTRERETLDGRARRAQLLLARELVLPVEILRGVRSFFHASEGEVSRAQFQRFVSSALRRYPSLYAVQWAPAVSASDREAYEERARREGLDGFRFTEEAGLQSVRTRAAAELYVPLYYAEPPNDALGFDLLSEPARQRSIETARDGGDVVGSRRFRLVEDPEGTFSVAAYLAVYRGGHVPPSEAERRARLAGLAIEVFRVGPLIEAALSRLRTDGIDVAVVDVDADGTEEVVHELVPGAAARIGSGRGVHASEPVPFAERRWEIRFHAPRGFAATRTAGFMLGGGLLATLILTLLAFLLARTRELSKAASRARRLGAYVIERKIGEGGMGVVFAATHAMLRRTAAVKLVSRATPTTLARFEREVRAASKLRHPNAVQIWDYGRTREGVFYYAMEYVDGLDLESVVRSDGPMHPGRAVAILVQVAGALREAHEAHLVHRDIKPANIMIAVVGGVPDFAKVLDFGLAKDLDDEDGPRTIVTEGKVVGTPLFVAPEQIDSPSDVDGRADLWSLGAVAYFLLSGHPPYEGASIGALVQARLDGPPVLPSVRRGRELPESLEALVMELLSKDPARRPADADALIRRLEALDDVERWRSVDAQRWWRERGAALRAAARTKHQDIDKTAGARIAVE